MSDTREAWGGDRSHTYTFFYSSSFLGHYRGPDTSGLIDYISTYMHRFGRRHMLFVGLGLGSTWIQRFGREKLIPMFPICKCDKR